MPDYKVISIGEHPELADQAAHWFHQKWGVPEEAYRESMAECLQNTSAVPQWYIVWENSRIIAGLGVIENDFHNRKDLAPNVCAVFVEEPFRCQGIAGKMLHFVCEDMASRGISTLYLLTDHNSFYERYGWEFYCMAQGNGEPQMSRMYRHTQESFT